MIRIVLAIALYVTVGLVNNSITNAVMEEWCQPKRDNVEQAFAVFFWPVDVLITNKPAITC